MTQPKNLDFAVVYEGFGKKYVDEALASARTLLRHNPGARVYLYTDRADADVDALGLVTLVRDWPPGMLSKVRAVADFPEERFVWIDTDTRICGSLAEFGRFLDLYGVSAALEPLRDARPWLPIDLGYAEEEMFPEMNCGVLAVNRALLPVDFFQCWLAVQAELAARNPEQSAEAMSDQYGLRITLGKTAVAPGILPNEFNFRACYPQAINTMPLVIHCRTPDPAWVERRLRGIDDLTMWLPFGVTLSRGGPVIRGAFWLYRSIEAKAAQLLGRKK